VKLPRELSGERVIRGLIRLGFTKERQHGSHVRLARGSLRVTVPAHQALAPKTLQSILRQAQISIEQLQDVL
jgi:predicted RNA binding protein YcfA (HicA-like mRNA interferase family)